MVVPSALAAELPEFDVLMAPGLNPTTPVNPAASAEVLSPPGIPAQTLPTTGNAEVAKSSSTTVGASLSQTSTLEDAFTAFAFPDDLRGPLLNLVGADENSEASILAALPFDTFREAVSKEVVLDSGMPPTLFQQGRFYKFFKDLNKALSAPPPPSTSPASSSQPILLQLPDSSNKLPFKDYLDQTATGTFTLLSESEISALRDNYVTRTGGSPSLEETPSDHQLSAMAHWIRTRPDGRLHAPFAEFATFVPFEGRQTKWKTFSAMVLTRDGTWSQRSLRGPQNFQQWEASWHVYATTLVMLDIAAPWGSQGVLSRVPQAR